MGLDCPFNTIGEQKEPKNKKPELITLSKQLLQEAQEAPEAPTKPPHIFEPRRSHGSAHDLSPIDPKTHERIGERQPYEETNETCYSHFLLRINRIGHDEYHPTEHQVAKALATLAEEWAQAREVERAKLRQYGVYEIITTIPDGHRPVDTK